MEIKIFSAFLFLAESLDDFDGTDALFSLDTSFMEGIFTNLGDSSERVFNKSSKDNTVDKNTKKSEAEDPSRTKSNSSSTKHSSDRVNEESYGSSRGNLNVSQVLMNSCWDPFDNLFIEPTGILSEDSLNISPSKNN